MACGWQQMLMEDIGRMEVSTEGERCSLEVAVRAMDVFWRPASLTIDFQWLSLELDSVSSSGHIIARIQAA